MVDVLRFIPEFNQEVQTIRKRHKIKPQKLSTKLRKLLGKDTYDKYIIKTQKFARGLYFPDLESADKLYAVEKKIATWESKKFPTISQEVGKLRICKLKGIIGIWHEAIKNYILYDQVTLSPVTFRKQFPQVNVKVDTATLEPYIEIRVYANTNISVFKQTKWLVDIEKKLPNYFNPNRRSEETFLNRFLYFILKKHARLPHKQINTWLKAKRLLGFPQMKSSREIKRFLELFVNSSN